MLKNGEELIETFGFDDARVGYNANLRVADIGRACVEALRKRGIEPRQFNKFDFSKNSIKNKTTKNQHGKNSTK